MRRNTAFGVVVLALAVALVAASPSGAYAQDPRGGGGSQGQGGAGGDRGGGGGGAGGGDRGGGGGVAPAPVSSPSSGGSTVSSGGMSSQPVGMATPRSFGAGEARGGRQVGTANPRWGGGNSAVSAGGEGRPFEGGGFRRSSADDQATGRTRAAYSDSSGETSVPWYSRSRGGVPSTGTAVSRPEVPTGGGGYYPGYPSYPWYPGYGGGYWGGYYGCYWSYYGCYGYPWGYGGFGLGYFYYNPFGWNYGDYFGYGGGGSVGYGTPAAGGIRLKVKPNTAKVYVDGYYAGVVDDFDNSFQKLPLAFGEHRIEISAPGYQPLVVEINIRDYETINYQGDLQPIR